MIVRYGGRSVMRRGSLLHEDEALHPSQRRLVAANDSGAIMGALQCHQMPNASTSKSYEDKTVMTAMRGPTLFGVFNIISEAKTYKQAASRAILSSHYCSKLRRSRHSSSRTGVSLTCPKPRFPASNPPCPCRYQQKRRSHRK